MFPKATNDTPTQVGAFRVILTDTPALNGQPAVQEAAFSVELLASDGRVVKQVSGDLNRYLPANQKLAVKNFLDSLRSRAAELLP